MKKNKILFLAFAFALIISTIGCTARPQNPGGTQTRIGLDSPNNDTGLRRNNNNLTRMDDNINRPGGDINRTDEDINRRQNNDPNNIARRDTDLAPNTRDDVQNDVQNDVRNDARNNNEENMSTRANEIAEEITNLDEVNRASVLINNRTAIVGVDMENNAEGEVTRNLKQKIERTVRDADDNIENVSISADPDLFTRISNMVRDIGDGRPMSGFGNEFEEILRRINPVR